MGVDLVVIIGIIAILAFVLIGLRALLAIPTTPPLPSPYVQTVIFIYCMIAVIILLIEIGKLHL